MKFSEQGVEEGSQMYLKDTNSVRWAQRDCNL